MSKLTKSEKKELREMIKFEDGKISDQDTLEQNFIDFMNKKYITKYKEKNDYQHIRVEKFIDINGEVDRTIPIDNEFIERTSVILYQQSTKDRRERGIKTKNESKNIEPIGQNDIGQKRQYEPHYKQNGQKIYLTFESSDDYSETSTTRYKIEQIYAKAYSEVERTIDNAINNLFDKYRDSDNKNEILFSLLINLNKYQLDYISRQALVFFINQELRNYHILNNQQKVLDRILCGEIPDANQKKILRRALNIPKNIPKKK